MSKYTEMQEFYKDALEREKKRGDYWRDRYLQQLDTTKTIEGKLATYEKIMDKLLGEPNKDATDSLFMFEGKWYLAQNFNLSREQFRPDELYVDFVECPELENIKKEK